MCAKIRSICAQKSDEVRPYVYFGIKKLQSFEKVGPEVFGTCVCGNLSPKGKKWL